MLEVKETADQLVERLKESKAYYDKALIQAMDQQQVTTDSKGNQQAKPITEEKAKLLARVAVREKGLEEPEIIRWRLLTLLDPPMYPDRDLTTNPRA